MLVGDNLTAKVVKTEHNAKYIYLFFSFALCRQALVGENRDKLKRIRQKVRFTPFFLYLCQVVSEFCLFPNCNTKTSEIAELAKSTATFVAQDIQLIKMIVLLNEGI